MNILTLFQLKCKEECLGCFQQINQPPVFELDGKGDDFSRHIPVLSSNAFCVMTIYEYEREGPNVIFMYPDQLQYVIASVHFIFT